MSARRCLFCASALYGRSEKRYCSSTCRRDASRVRKRTIRLGGYEFDGRERPQSASVEEVMIPKLERLHGPNHRLVHQARREAERLREKEFEELARVARYMSWGLWGEG